tara:strand:+ start:212 stop:589 length:378 start_codon:yes stop_codon:yes gene_type:complete
MLSYKKTYKNLLLDFDFSLVINNKTRPYSVKLSSIHHKSGKIMTEEEANTLVYNYPVITLTSGKFGQTYCIPKGFTRQQLLDIILKFEQKFRIPTEWLGYIDVNNIYFKGLKDTGFHTFEILWGS